MPELVFIREIDPNTVLHFAARGEGTCLRDYSRGPLCPPVENRGYTTSQVKELLKQPGNNSEKAPDHPVTDHSYWHQVICDRNAWLGYPGNEGPGQFFRLLDQFHAEVAPFVAPELSPNLAVKIQDWTAKFAAIEEKSQGFNHWDDDDSSGLFRPTEGRRLISQMLEFSRASGSMHHIDTADPSLDFALLVMEPNLSISSKNNPFIHDAKSSLNLDGLGLRSDGTFCILEVKAESDCPELFRATIQALCGAVAVHAKREMISRLAQNAKGRRPAASMATIPSDRTSLGLYVMVDHQTFRFPEDPAFVQSIRLLMEAFTPIREIAYFSVDPGSTEFPSRIPVRQVFRRDSTSLLPAGRN